MFGLLRPSPAANARTLPASYMSVYCDLCAVLSLQYGLTARPLVVHDLVSLGWLLESHNATSTVFPRLNCVRGGTRSVPLEDRRPTPRARLLAALSCYAVSVKLRDDIRDQPSWRVRALTALYTKTFTRAHRELERVGFPVGKLEEILAQQDHLERRKTADLDIAAGPTGCAYALVAEGVASSSPTKVPVEKASRIGDALGRCVYVIDAYRDIEADAGLNYNPLCCGAAPLETQLLAGRREARAYIATQLRLVGEALSGPADLQACRWPALERRLRRLVGLDPATITLNATCCVPCGDGAVAADDTECFAVLCGCTCCAACLCGRFCG